MLDTETRFGPTIIRRATTSASKTRKQNPFSIPANVDLFGGREDEKLRKDELRDTIRNLSLVQRTNLITPNIPDFIVRDSQKPSRTMSSLADEREVAEGFRTIQERKKLQSQRMAEFIQQKREIYLVQLLIDRKNSEIRKIGDNIAQQEKHYDELERQFTENKLKYKIASAKIERDLAKARKEMEAATLNRVDMQKQLKMKKTSNEIMKSEILKNLEALEFMSMCKDFLVQLTPADQDPSQYFTHPSQLTTKLEDIETGNLFIFQHLQHINQLLERNLASVNSEVARTDALIHKAMKEVEQIVNVEVIEMPEPTAETQDAELAVLQKMVRNTHKKCFGAHSASTTIVQLERIENDMERMYRILEILDPTYVSEKQQVMDKERRDELRHARQEKQAQEQRVKIAQAIERANKPIKKKTGRPILARTVPIKVQKHDDEKLRKIRVEQERTENLLYGPVYD